MKSGILKMLQNVLLNVQYYEVEYPNFKETWRIEAEFRNRWVCGNICANEKKKIVTSKIMGESSLVRYFWHSFIHRGTTFM